MSESLVLIRGSVRKPGSDGTYSDLVSSEERDRSKTRDRILDEAFALFVTVGFQGTTLSEVERRVGLKVGTGSLYHHFRSKAALLQAAVEREVQRCTADVNAERAAMAWPQDPREQIWWWRRG